MKHVILDNGLQIVTVPIDSDFVTIRIVAAVGADCETKKNMGIMHFLEHACIRRGTKKMNRKRLRKELDKRASEFDANAGRDYTDYEISGPIRFFKKNLALLADVYLHPAFPRSEMEIEKRIILEEMRGEANHPEEYSDDLLEEVVFGNQRAGWSIYGTEQGIKNITYDELCNHRDMYYVASNTIVMIGGKMNERKAIEDVKKVFSEIPTGIKFRRKPYFAMQKRPRVRLLYKRNPQTNIRIGFRACGESNIDDSIALDIISAFLGESTSSRIEERLREIEGISYTNGTALISHRNRGLLNIYADVNNRRVISKGKKQGAIEMILDEVAKLKNKTLSRAELDRMKSFLINQLNEKKFDITEMLDFYQNQLINQGFMESIRERIKRIKKATPRKVQAAARRYFRNNRLSLVVVGPFKDKKQLQKILKI